MKLGDRLKKAREAKGWTQAELGLMLNVSDATINRYEKGLRSPDPHMLKMLAELLEVSIDSLVGTVTTSDNVNRIELEEFINTHRLQFCGAEVDETDKKEVLDFLNYYFHRKQKIAKGDSNN